MNIFTSFICFLHSFPSLNLQFENANLNLFPINKKHCDKISPLRDVRFELYTKENPIMPFYLWPFREDNLGKSYMNFGRPTIFFFHGFLESGRSEDAAFIRQAYLSQGDYNIIVVNSLRLYAGPWYVTAAKNVQAVGRYAARFIDYLVDNGLDLWATHLIGHSLGAHCAGVAGGSLKRGRVARITGLDPAKPLFLDKPLEERLDRGDAFFVDIIHTDAGIFGYPESIGHVDFWPNGGSAPQPGCDLFETPILNNVAPYAITPLVFCSHWKSYQYYAESVHDNNAFPVYTCQSKVGEPFKNCTRAPYHMGYLADAGMSGNFFLRTSSTFPYSLSSL